MTKHLATQRLLCVLCVLVGTEMHYAQGGSYAYQETRRGTAVDVKGRRHTAGEYPGQRAPWNFADRLAAAAPQYPTEALIRHQQGVGSFRIVIDTNTGQVAQVIILRSTGYVLLDSAAVAALRRWRWKPGTWKEVDMPVAFQKVSGPVRVAPPGTIALPR